MIAEQPKVYDLHYVVQSVMADLSINDMTKYETFLKWSIDGFKRMGLAGVLPLRRTVKLPVDDQNICYLPPDYEEFQRIGICWEGTWLTFDINDNICPPDDSPCVCSKEDIVTAQRAATLGNFDYFQNYYHFPGFFHNGQFTSGFYGLGEGFFGAGYKLDEPNRRIMFDSYVMADEVLLEYKSNGIDDDGNAFVPGAALPAITNYVHWKRCTFSIKRDDRESLTHFQQQFWKELRAYNKRRLSLNITEFYRTLRKGIHMMPKR